MRVLEIFCEIILNQSQKFYKWFFYKNKQTEFTYFQKLRNRAAVSKQQYSQSFYNFQQAHDTIKIALARIDQIKTSIARALIIAPKNGTILQVNTRAGEFANVNPFDRKPLMIFGDISTYQLRVAVAEEDAWRIQHGAPATAFVRGNNKIRIPLTFEYIEPYIIPKQVLTGSDIERVDTRVLQIIYTFKADHYPLYIGQLLDAFVEAQPSKTIWKKRILWVFFFWFRDAVAHLLNNRTIQCQNISLTHMLHVTKNHWLHGGNNLMILF